MNQWVLYHYPLCPFSRKFRIILKEKKVDFQLIVENYWERNKNFLAMNPAGNTPVLFNNESRNCYAGNYALFEFIEQNFNEYKILCDDYYQNYRARAIAEWFDNKFFNEVTKYLIEEKIMKQVTKNINAAPPNSAAIRASKKNITRHLDYLSFLLKDGSGYLNGERVGLADFAAAAQLSVLDYMGDVPWEYNYTVKIWYALLKSRPSFKTILQDEVGGVFRAPHYSDPDF